MSTNSHKFTYILSKPVTINGGCRVQYSTQSTFQPMINICVEYDIKVDDD